MATNGTVTVSPKRPPERVLRVIQLFDQEGADPREIAKKLKFENHRELGQFMHRHGYAWSGEQGNYVRETEGEAGSAQDADDKEAVPEIEAVHPLTPESFNQYGDLLQFLMDNQENLRRLLGSGGGPQSGEIPRFAVPGTLVTKSVHMPADLDMLTRTFSKEKNITQRDLFQVALIEFFQKYGYAREVNRLLEGA